MSRAEDVAKATYPNYWKFYPFETNKEARAAFIKGYEQAEKDTIERAESHLESVLLNFLDVDTVKWIIKDFKKAMEEE